MQNRAIDRSLDPDRIAARQRRTLRLRELRAKAERGLTLTEQSELVGLAREVLSESELETGTRRACPNRS